MNTAFSIWNDGSYPFSMNRSSFLPVERTDGAFRARGISRHWSGNHLPNIILPPLLWEVEEKQCSQFLDQIVICLIEKIMISKREHSGRPNVSVEVFTENWRNYSLVTAFVSICAFNCCIYNPVFKGIKEKRKKKHLKVTHRTKWKLAITSPLLRNCKLSET